MKLPSWTLLLLLTAGLSTGGFGIQAGEFKCESALAHVKDCCGTMFDATAYQCVSDGCRDLTPDLTIEEADCLRSKSCNDMKALGICDQARLGGGAQVDHQQCDQALTTATACCGQAFADRWTCQVSSSCGVVQPGETNRLLASDVISCINTLASASATCDQVKASGVCDDIEAPACH